MNRERVYLQEGDRVELARKHILAYGITAVPVLDEDHRSVGVVSLRDLDDDARKAHRVSKPANTIASTATVEAAARQLVSTDYHHRVVVDADGRAAGMVSAVDLLRAMVGALPRHSQAITNVPSR